MNSTIKASSATSPSCQMHIRARLIDAVIRAFGDTCADIDPIVMNARNPEFGDFQSTVAMQLKQKLAKAPRQIATEIVAHLGDDAMYEKPTIDGPGFINFRISRSQIEAQLAAMHADERLGVQAVTPRKVIVDMSSPNIAKEMHVGHLRSTIIGESLARLLAFLGHDVKKINHVGDWGTQFGMLIAELKEKHPEALSKPDTLALGDIVAFYKQAKQHFDADPAFAETARQEVVKLQSGNADSLRAWELLCNQSRVAFEKIYSQLGISDLIEVGESHYNPMLKELVKIMQDAGIAVESDGAVCVFMDGYKNRDGDPLPLIIQKKDEGFNYATTDLAAMRHRAGTESATMLIYVIDAGQAQHVEMVTKAARLAGLIDDKVQVEHVPFGLVLGADGKKLKTRSGETVRLQDLLDEAVVHAQKQLAELLAARGESDSPEWIEATGKAIGIAAVKYNDLSLNRTTNYKYSPEKMLSLEGNTAPFILYSYARVMGISREGGVELNGMQARVKFVLSEPQEVELAKHLLQFDAVVQGAAASFLPNRLCEYLFELSQLFNRFYHEHSVLDAPEPQRTSRLGLCSLTASTIKLGMNLLGIEVLERM